MDYEPSGTSSLFDQWEAGIETPTSAPLAVIDLRYRSFIVGVLNSFRESGRRLVSVGAGNGYVEANLRSAGWDVLATDPAAAALRLCGAKGLRTTPFRLLADAPPGRFDVIYSDGVLGHLWEPRAGSTRAWDALGHLGHAGSLCVVSNDLADDDERAQFGVRGAPGASFYRPPAGWYARDAAAAGEWSIEARYQYAYTRNGRPRRREVIVARRRTDELKGGDGHIRVETALADPEYARYMRAIPVAPPRMRRDRSTLAGSIDARCNPRRQGASAVAQGT